MITAKDIAGIFPATVTPMKPDGSVNYDMIASVVNHVVDGGAKGVIPSAGTGEYTNLSNDERRRVVEASVEAMNGRGPVIAGALSPGYADNMLVARDAKAAGADAVMLVLPFYATGHDQGMADYVRRFRDEIDMPVVLYEIPGRTGVTIGVDHMAKLAEEGVVIGMKFSDINVERCAHLASLTNDDFCLLGGQEGLMTYHCQLGAKGAVLAAANVFPRFWAEALRLGTEGDFAAMVHHLDIARPMLNTCFMEPNPGPIKVGMKLLGLDCGGTRLPLQPVRPDTVKQVEAMMADFKDWSLQDA